MNTNDQRMDQSIEALREREWEHPAHQARLRDDLIRAGTRPAATAGPTRRRGLWALAGTVAVAGVGLASVGVFRAVEATRSSGPEPVDVARHDTPEPVLASSTPRTFGSTGTPVNSVASVRDGRASTSAESVTPRASAEPERRAAGGVTARTSAHDPSSPLVEVPVISEVRNLLLERIDSLTTTEGWIVLAYEPTVTMSREQLRQAHPDLFRLRADLSGDGRLDQMDVVRFTDSFLLGDADLNADGITSTADYLAFVESYFSGEEIVRRDAEPRVSAIVLSESGLASEDLITLAVEDGSDVVLRARGVPTLENLPVVGMHWSVEAPTQTVDAMVGLELTIDPAIEAQGLWAEQLIEYESVETGTEESEPAAP